MEFVDMIWGYIAPVWNWLVVGLAIHYPPNAGGEIN